MSVIDKRTFDETQRFDASELAAIQGYLDEAVERVLVNTVLGTKSATYGLAVTGTGNAAAPGVSIAAGGIFSSAGSGRQEAAVAVALPVTPNATPDKVYEVVAKVVRVAKDAATVTTINPESGAIGTKSLDRRDYAGIQASYYLIGNVPPGVGWFVLAEVTVNEDAGVTAIVDRRPSLHTLLGARPDGSAGSHHDGKAGSGEKVNVAEEVQGKLPVQNLDVLNSGLFDLGMWRANAWEHPSATPSTETYPTIEMIYAGAQYAHLAAPLVIPDAAAGKSLWNMNEGGATHKRNTFWHFQAYLFNPATVNITLDGISFDTMDAATAYLSGPTVVTATRRKELTIIGQGKSGGPALTLNGILKPGLNILDIVLWNKGDTATSTAYLQYATGSKTLLARCNELGVIFGLFRFPDMREDNYVSRPLVIDMKAVPNSDAPPSRWPPGGFSAYSVYDPTDAGKFPDMFGTIASWSTFNVSFNQLFMAWPASGANMDVVRPNLFYRAATDIPSVDKWTAWDRIITRGAPQALKMWGIILTDGSANPYLYAADGVYTLTKVGSIAANVAIDTAYPEQKALFDQLKYAANPNNGFIQVVCIPYRTYDLGASSHKYPVGSWFMNDDGSAGDVLRFSFDSVVSASYGGSQIVASNTTFPANYVFLFFVYALI